MKPVVLIGAGQFAEYVRYLLENALGERVAAFAVDRKYLAETAGEKDGLPVVAYQELRELYPPAEYCVAVAFLGDDMFDSREKTFLECVAWGYDLPNLIHPSVVDQSVELGEGNIIGAGTVLGPFTRLGRGNVLFDLSFTAHNVTVGSFNLLTAHVSPMGNCVIGSHCFVGAGSTVNNRVVLADYTLVGANAFVRRDTRPYQVVVPARGVTLEGKKSTDFGI